MSKPKEDSDCNNELLNHHKVDNDDISCSDESNTQERETWSNQREFILSVVGYCVGLGNIWRFPYVCMKNGGGAFLIPFLVSLFICGIPAFYMEMALGQFLGKSAFHVWSFCPLLKGMGISVFLLSLICVCYYSMILGWTLIYFVNSFMSPLPWTLCDQSWNTPLCVKTRYTEDNATLSTSFHGTNSVMANNETSVNAIAIKSRNETVVSAAEEFWLHSVLDISSGLGDLGGLPWHTAVALVVANLFVLIGVAKGIKSSGKVVYVTATLPYILLTVFFILGTTLEGASEGINFYIKPDFGKLMTYTPWMEAAIQVFYSLGPGWGGIITMASYNKFNSNVQRDVIALALCCEGTSIFGGFVVFMILGHMAHKAGVAISEFARSGAGLVFVVYPEAISYLPLPQLWGFLFFMMLFTLGLDSMFTAVETNVTVISDLNPKFFKKWRILGSMGTVTFITMVGLLFATRGGIYWFQLIDWYIAAFAVLLQGAIECLAVSWIYGSDRFCGDIELMIGRKPFFIFVWAWKVITPVVLLILWAVTLTFYQPPIYRRYVYPGYAEVIGWITAVGPFMAVIVYALYELTNHSGSLSQRLRKACTPSSEWAPTCPFARKKYKSIILDQTDTQHSNV